MNFPHQGKKAIEKGARNQPAAYLKILALLVPRADRQTQKSVRRQPRWVNAIKGADLREERGLAPVDVLVRESSAPPWSVPPKVLEPVGRHFGVPDRVLNVLVPEVVLKGPRVVAIIGQLEPAGMAEHVRVDREWHVSGFPEALDEPVEADGTDWPAALGNEHVGVLRVIAS